MTLAIGVALGSIALGAGLGLWPGQADRAASPFRTFAVVTAVAVVLGQLLPESLGAVGLPALLVFGLGFALPRLMERAAFAITRKPNCEHHDAMCTDLGLEVGYVGLLMHRIGDGIGLGLYGGPAHAGHGHYDVLLAIAGHTVPVTALVVLAFRTHRGAGSAALRALGVAGATLLGVELAGSLTTAQLHVFEPWLTALVGGLLLHIVTHGWPHAGEPTLATRLLDLGAIAAGLGLVVMGGHSHAAERGLPDIRHAMGDALVELGLETAPMLLLGLAVAAVLQSQGDRIPTRWLRGGSRVGQALRGAALGVPLPVCACGILPVAHSLRARGGAAAVVVAFLIATPELGVETFALTVTFLGWDFALLRLGGAMLVAVVAALALSRFAPPEPAPAADGGHGCNVCGDSATACGTNRSLTVRVLGHFDDLVHDIGAWILVGLLAAAYVQATLDGQALRAIAGSGLDVLLMTLLAVPSYVCASSATPLAAVLLAKGMSPGAVLTGLLLGPATNLATVAWLRKAYGARAMRWGLAALLVSTWGIAALANGALSGALVDAVPALEHAHAYGPVELASAGLLGLLFLRSVWREGLQAWLGSLGEAIAVGDHGDGHGHGVSETPAS
jgi:hypothetical protein